MNKRTWILVAAAVSALALAGCGGGNSSSDGTTSGGESAVSQTTAASGTAEGSGENITLTMWVDFITPERTEYLNRMIEQYMAENPGITIELTPLPDTAADKLMTAYEAGQGPDIFMSSGPQVSDHVNGDYIIPLDEYFDNWDKKDQILPSAIETVRTWDITGEDKLWYIPNGISWTVMWVRSDWLSEAGASVDTWDNLFDAVEKMTDKDAGRYGIAIRGGSGGAKFLERMMYSYSGILSKFDENGKCTINDPKNVEFVERYLGLYGDYTAEGDINYGWTELSAAFDSGAAGLIIHNLGSATDHLEAFDGDLSKFEAINMPLNDQGTSVNLMIQPGGMTISSTCEHPQEAFDFIAYMTTGDQVSEYCQQWGVIPVDQEVLENAEWIKEYPWYENSAEALLNPDTEFYEEYSWLPGHDNIYNEIDTESQYVMAGEMTAQEMCDNWAAALQECYDNYFNQ